MRKTILTNDLIYSYACDQAISPSLMALLYLPLFLPPLIIGIIIPGFEFMLGIAGFLAFILIVAFFLALIDESNISTDNFEIGTAELFYGHIDGVKIHALIVKERDQTGKMRVKRQKCPVAYYDFGSFRRRRRVVCRISNEFYDECKERGLPSQVVILKLPKGFPHVEYYAFHPDWFENRSSISF